MQNKKLLMKMTAGAFALAMSVGATSLTALAEAAGEWREEEGKLYWYENGVKQGYDANNPDYRGKEIFDPGSNAWYWLDNVQGGAKAVSKDVYQESQADDAGNMGKWVRYDAEGHMIKGWNTNENGTYYFDPVYGTMLKGWRNINGVDYRFDDATGILQESTGGVEGNANGWRTIDGVEYWYENGVRQGTEGRGKEIFDPSTNAWYWLDAVDAGKKAVSKDVYQESQADDAGTIGKWVRYDANGHMMKGWDGDYYFDPTYGTMAKGNVTIDGVEYYFDENTGVCQGEVNAEGDTRLSWEYEKITEYGADGSIDYIKTFTYDSDGDTKTYVYTSDYADYTTYYDEQERIIEELAAYKYNDEIFYGRIAYSYEGDNTTCSKMVQYYKESEAAEWMVEEIYVNTYNEQGDLATSKRYYDTEDAAGLDYETEYKYDDKGQRIEDITYYYENGEKVPGQRITYAYDANGNLIEETQYAAGTGELHTKYTYKYNENNDVIEYTYARYSNGVESWRYTTVSEYDGNGNCIKETTYDADSNIFSWIEATYADVRGYGRYRTTSKFYYDKDGVVDRGYEYIYENGALVRDNYYGDGKELESYTIYGAEDYPENVKDATFVSTDDYYNGDGSSDGKIVYEFKCFEFVK